MDMEQDKEDKGKGAKESSKDYVYRIRIDNSQYPIKVVREIANNFLNKPIYTDGRRLVKLCEGFEFLEIPGVREKIIELAEAGLGCSTITRFFKECGIVISYNKTKEILLEVLGEQRYKELFEERQKVFGGGRRGRRSHSGENKESGENNGSEVDNVDNKEFGENSRSEINNDGSEMSDQESARDKRRNELLDKYYF